MIITCENCKTRFRLDDALITRSVFKAKCSRCGHIFTAHRGAQDGEEPLVLERVAQAPHRVITVCNQKGGVAKTSTCVNLGFSLALMGKKVLLVDFDVQANLSVLMGCRNGRSFFDVVESGGPDDLQKAILKVRPNIWVLPSNSRMALSSKRYFSQRGFEQILAGQIRKIRDFFDYVLIDTPPSLDFFTVNALMASDLAIIPTQAEFLAVNGVNHVENIISVIREKTGHETAFRVLVTMFDESNTASKVIRKQLIGRLGDRIFRTIVVHDRKIQESQILRTPVIQYDRNSPAGRQYISLAKELVEL